MSNTNRTDKSVRFALLNAVALAGLMTTPALAQDASETVSEEEIVVTGYRASLRSSTEAKRNSVNFTDSVFAEDIGQFPDLNIAESLNRIPGITIAREVNGEGLNIAIRGLGTNFTKTVLNGNQISVASSGSADSQNVNRELDLDVFPTELFTRLDVHKTPTAHLLEGGAAGVVDMRGARPFDYSDSQITYTFQDSYAEQSETWSPRAAIIASGRWETGIGEFGILAGYAGVRNHSTTLGYETIGVTNANLTYRQCGLTPPVGTDPDTPAAACNTSGGNGWQIAAPANGTDPIVPNNPSTVGAGLTPGAIVDMAFLLEQNPGLSIQQIGNALLPRLGRPAYFDGDRDRDAMVVSLQYAPNDRAEFYFDIMGARADRAFNRLDLMFEVRNSNFMIPIDMQVDDNNVVTQGTFVNSRLFLEARPYHEELEFIYVNPGARIELGEDWRLDIQGSMSRSVFFREQPTIGLVLPNQTVEFNNTGGDFPNITYSANPNDPDAGWQWLRVNLQNEKRVTATRGIHGDMQWGEDEQNIRMGVAFDQIERTITALDNTGGWQNFICGGGLPPPPPGGSAAGCTGGPGSAVPTANIGDFLQPSAAGFVTPDFGRLFEVSNYQQFFETAPIVSGAATGARSGAIDESTLGAYIEATGDSEFLERTLRYNFGVRYATTDQTITSPLFLSNVFQNFQSLDSAYDAYLPSFNGVLELTDDINIRMAASRTMTRADPNAMLPATTFTDPSAQNANQGNPNLTPFFSTNFDFGGEWYTGNEGYFGVMLFNKTLTGFTVTGTNIIPFRQLGIAFESLTLDQQTAINGRGGQDVATVTVTQQVNAGGTLSIKGYELTWVQPLDFVLDGLGFTANYTRISQSASGAGAPTNATNVPPSTYNVTAYYENFGFSGRLSYTYLDASTQTAISGPQDGFPFPANPQPGYRFNDARGQLDAALRYTFDFIPSEPQLTLDLININGATRRETQGFDNLTYKYYEPGYSVLLGIRGTF